MGADLQKPSPDAVAFAETFDVSRETIDRLEIYIAALKHWQRRVNLVSASTLDDIWTRHIADCAQLIRLKPDAGRWLDLGTGAGLPGIVLGIMLLGQPGAKAYLIESNGKKVSFLRDVAHRTGASVEILGIRIETLLATDRLPKADVVTARALAPLHQLLEWAQPVIEAGGTALFLKGRGVEDEIESARRVWSFAYTLHPSVTASGSAIVEISQLQHLKQPSDGGKAR